MDFRRQVLYLILKHDGLFLKKIDFCAKNDLNAFIQLMIVKVKLFKVTFRTDSCLGRFWLSFGRFWTRFRLISADFG